jgi:predicted dienelactone hydrolase
MKKIGLLGFLSFICFFTNAQSDAFVYGDSLPDAPKLAPRGTYGVGVKTLEFTNKQQVDIIKSIKGGDALYDRKLKVEVWYPAEVKIEAIIKYEDVMGTANDPKRPIIPFTFAGRASREANPIRKDGKFPLIIVSHGYVGSRYLMTYLTENLASKGYVVVAIDHTESTFRDAGAFSSTLLNRAKDIPFVLNQMVETNNSGFFKDFIDTENIGLIGYSMGGYGVLNVAGAGYSKAADQLFSSFTGGSKALAPLVYENSEYQKTRDPRIKAVVAFAPWGMERNVWDSTSLKGLKKPTLFIAGDQDDISGYEKGIKKIFDGATNAPRYMLTYQNARHNIAPNPAPKEALGKGLPFDEYYRYAEPSWDSRRINNINQHFITAFMGMHLKKLDYQKFLDLPEKSNPKNWFGFPGRSSTGLELRKGVINN